MYVKSVANDIIMAYSTLTTLSISQVDHWSCYTHIHTPAHKNLLLMVAMANSVTHTCFHLVDHAGQPRDFKGPPAEF